MVFFMLENEINEFLTAGLLCCWGFSILDCDAMVTFSILDCDAMVTFSILDCDAVVTFSILNCDAVVTFYKTEYPATTIWENQLS